MITVVFSKDRAMQLDAFLRSRERHVEPLDLIYVLYDVSSERHGRAYVKLFEKMPDVIPVAQGRSFRETLLYILKLADKTVLFFVDDQIFIREWRVLERPGLSLRMGLNLTHDYNQSSDQPLPPYTKLENDLIEWRWAEGALSWGYPLSVDGHIYDLEEMRMMASSVPFHSPNTFETALQAYLPRFSQRSGFCYRESKVVNTPWNTVQSDWRNRCADSASADMLLDAWESGYRINVDRFHGLLNKSVHEDLPLELEKVA